MEHSTLEAFVTTALRNQRIRFGDVRRLQRNVLPAGLTNATEAETLLALDRSVPNADPAWTDFVVGAVRDYVVDRRDPGNEADRDRAGWLQRVVGPRPSRTELAIAREVALRANQVRRAGPMSDEGASPRHAGRDDRLAAIPSGASYPAATATPLQPDLAT